jgi:hypothetical protein
MPQYSENFAMPYPEATDPVNVHGDIKNLVDKLNIILPPLGISAFQIPVINNSGEDLPAGTPVYASGYTTKTNITKSLPETTNPILGLVKTDIDDTEEGIVVVAGVMEDINTQLFEAGDILYVGNDGGLTNLRPESGSGAVGICVNKGVTNGIIIVEAKGNGTWGALKAGLA